MKEVIVTFCGQKAKVGCDENCKKAWGCSSRPKVHMSDNIDDYGWLADGELGEAPTDPGTYEGGHRKPSSSVEFPNKWCVRECERCVMSMPGESELPLKIKDYSKRQYNLNSRN